MFIRLHAKFKVHLNNFNDLCPLAEHRNKLEPSRSVRVIYQYLIYPLPRNDFKNQFGKLELRRIYSTLVTDLA